MVVWVRGHYKLGNQGGQWPAQAVKWKRLWNICTPVRRGLTPKEGFTILRGRHPLLSGQVYVGFTMFLREECTGLTNFGSTCYINSVLQCLMNSPKFVEACFQRTLTPRGPQPHRESPEDLLYQVLACMRNVCLPPTGTEERNALQKHYET